MWTNKVSFGLIEKKRMGENLITKLDETSWQKEFLEMKFHSLSDVKLLTEGVKGLLGAYRLGVLNQEYKRLKKIQEKND